MQRVNSKHIFVVLFCLLNWKVFCYAKVNNELNVSWTGEPATLHCNNGICASIYASLTMMESATVLISQQVRSLMKHSGGISKDIAHSHIAFFRCEVLGKSKKLYVKKKKILHAKKGLFQSRPRRHLVCLNFLLIIGLPLT